MATAERIERIFSESLNIEIPSTNTDIIESGLLDSLVFVTLLYEIEEEFGVELPLEDIDIERLRTIERIADLVDELAESSSSDERLAPEPA
jgi:acyl carrier protein